MNRCINREVKYYGLGAFGLVFGFITTLFVWVNFSIVFGMIGGMVGYFIGDTIAKYWYRGQMQRYIYWNCPITFYTKINLPPSSYRNLL